MLVKVVEHKFFQRGILISILFNTLSMGIEYHNQVGPLSRFFLNRKHRTMQPNTIRHARVNSVYSELCYDEFSIITNIFNAPIVFLHY